MKRIGIFCLCVLILLLSAVSVSAAPTADPGHTTPTAAAQKEFDFTVSGTKMNVTWNADEFPGTTVDMVMIGTRSIEVSTSSAAFSVSLVDVEPGIYTVRFVLSDGGWVEAPKKLERAGTLGTKLAVSLENNHIVASLADENDAPLSNYPVFLLFFGNEIATENTNEQGRVTFSVAPPSDLSNVTCQAKNHTIGVITYTGSSAGLQGTVVTTEPPVTKPTTPSTGPSSQVTTAPTSEPTSITREFTPTMPTTPSSQTTAIGTPTSWYWGNGTTAVKNDLVALSVAVDPSLALPFGIKTESLSSQSRLWVNQAVYSRLVDASSLQLQLVLQSSLLTLTTEQIQALVNSDRYDYSSAAMLALDLSLVLYDPTSSLSSQLSADAGDVTVELPVPASMSGREMVVAVYDRTAGSIKTVDSSVDGHTVSFHLNNGVAPVLFIGLNEVESDVSVTRIVLISLIVLGALLLIGAGVMAYFVFLRKKPSAASAGRHAAPAEKKVPLVAEEDFMAVFPEDRPTSSAPTSTPETPDQESAHKKKDVRDYDIDL